MLKSYYEILKIARDATTEEIAHAYETLIEKYRERLGEEEFNKNAAILDKAYNVLTDEYKRAKYDRMLEEMETATHLDEAVEVKPAEPKIREAKPVKPEPEIPQPKMARTMAEVKQERKARPEPGRFARTSYLATDESEEEEVRQKPKVAGLVIAIVVVFLLIAGGAYYFYNYMYVPENNYNKALALVDQGQYDEAIEAFTALKDYKQSVDQIANAKRSKGVSLVKQKQFDKAMEIFTALGNQEDILDCKTAQAEDLLSQKKYDEAAAIFTETQNTDGLKKCEYAKAADMKAAGNLQEAFAAFKALGSYKDSGNQLIDIKNAIQAQVQADLANIDQTHLALDAVDTLKQSLVKLNGIDALAKSYEIEGLYAEIESKWALAEGYYAAAYYKGTASDKDTWNKKYFTKVGLTNTDKTDKIEDKATAQFKKDPDYVSLYADCLKGVSEESLNVTWYKYTLDRATAEYTERSEVAKSTEKTLPEIRHDYTALFSFKKNAFKYGAGLYAAEVTVGDGTEPAAVVYFYLQ